MEGDSKGRETKVKRWPPHDRRLTQTVVPITSLPLGRRVAQDLDWVSAQDHCGDTPQLIRCFPLGWESVREACWPPAQIRHRTPLGSPPANFFPLRVPRMPLLDWLWQWLFPGPRTDPASATPPSTPLPSTLTQSLATPGTAPLVKERVRLTPRTYREPLRAARGSEPTASRPPYLFARPVAGQTLYLDHGHDTDPARLAHWGLPDLRTPADLARWLGLLPHQLAWLTHRFRVAPESHPSPTTDHYHRHHRPKRRGGRRLLESPKPRLKQAQLRILREILDRVPPHHAAHGFRRGRSILTNARPHVGQGVVLRLDLADFYPSVTYGRVVALFRSLGYCREVACWLARLTTTSTPRAWLEHASFIESRRLARRHLPQGAPTSPALANLSAFVADLRLAGLARSFNVQYTRYADDLTFSGPTQFRGSLRVFLPLVRQILAEEHFTLQRRKTRVERASQQQRVTGVVVNAKLNCSRRDFDRLKAILTNSLRHGPRSQNRDGHPEFASQLRGQIAHITQLNPRRGAQLLAIYRQIDWSR